MTFVKVLNGKLKRSGGYKYISRIKKYSNFVSENLIFFEKTDIYASRKRPVSHLEVLIVNVP